MFGGINSFSEFSGDSGGFKIAYRSGTTNNSIQVTSTQTAISNAGTISLYGADGDAGISLSKDQVFIRTTKGGDQYIAIWPTQTAISNSAASITVGNGQGLDSGGRSTNGIKLGGNTVVTNVFSVNGVGKFYSNVSVSGTLYTNTIIPLQGAYNNEVRVGGNLSAWDIWLDSMSSVGGWVGQWIVTHNNWAADKERRLIAAEGSINDLLNRVGSLEGRMSSVESRIGSLEGKSYVDWGTFGRHYHYLDNGHRETAMAGDPLHSHDYLVQHDTGGPIY